ncbi:Zinc finger, C2H2-like [Penicillium camemberti]|uniref:Zinc finger, C2H2-like n=1 Tax=Penicillium camemberti (strain FM 013) TaxID=1429867 RepID=A0A0G4P2M3_PENC3|nr:Zinc finger, C2H2-like [Penicillium camemberti]
MVYTSDLEEYLRLRQIFQPSSEKRNSHAETSAMQPPPPFAGQSSLPSAGWPLYDPSMSHTSAFLGPSWTTPTQPPTSAVGHRPVPSTNWSLYDPSMGHVSRSPHPGRTMHTAIGHPTADNFYQGNMQTSPTMQYRDTEVGTEDHLSPGQTTAHTWSSTPSPSTQESSPPNQHSSGAATVESNFVHGEPQQQDESDGSFKCGWGGCTRRETFSSHASLMRHIKVQHVAHRSVKCPECGQAFGRVDNMKEHRGRRHRMFD